MQTTVHHKGGPHVSVSHWETFSLDVDFKATLCLSRVRVTLSQSHLRIMYLWQWCHRCYGNVFTSALKRETFPTVKRLGFMLTHVPFSVGCLWRTLRCPFQSVLDFSVIDWLSHQSRRGYRCDAANDKRPGAGLGSIRLSKPLGDVRATWEWENPVWTSVLPGITLNEFCYKQLDLHNSL